MFKDAWAAFDVARPLKGNMLVGAHAHPSGYRQVNCLEIKIISWIAEVSHSFLASLHKHGGFGAVGLLNSPIKLRLGTGQLLRLRVCDRGIALRLPQFLCKPLA